MPWCQAVLASTCHALLWLAFIAGKWHRFNFITLCVVSLLSSHHHTLTAHNAHNTHTTHILHLILNTTPFQHSHTDSQRGREFILYRISCYTLVLVVDVGCCTACTRLKSVVRTQSQTRAFLAFKYTIGKRLFCVEFEFEFEFQL